MPRKSRRPDYPAFDKAIPGSGGGTQPFYPNQLPNQAAWFRFGVGITVTGQGVSTWADQSGNSRDLLQATDGNRPLLQTDGSILFPGVDEFLQTADFTLNQPITIYILFKQITYLANNRIFDGNGVAVVTLRQASSSPNLRINAGGDSLENPLVLNTYGAVACVFNGAASLLQVNNTISTGASVGANNAGGLTLGAAGDGASLWTNMQVKELIIYSAAHDASFRNLVLGYFVRLGL